MLPTVAVATPLARAARGKSPVVATADPGAGILPSSAVGANTPGVVVGEITRGGRAAKRASSNEEDNPDAEAKLKVARLQLQESLAAKLVMTNERVNEMKELNELRAEKAAREIVAQDLAASREGVSPQPVQAQPVQPVQQQPVPPQQVTPQPVQQVPPQSVPPQQVQPQQIPPQPVQLQQPQPVQHQQVQHQQPQPVQHHPVQAPDAQFRYQPGHTLDEQFRSPPGRAPVEPGFRVQSFQVLPGGQPPPDRQMVQFVPERSLPPLGQDSMQYRFEREAQFASEHATDLHNQYALQAQHAEALRVIEASHAAAERQLAQAQAQNKANRTRDQLSVYHEIQRHNQVTNHPQHQMYGYAQPARLLHHGQYPPYSQGQLQPQSSGQLIPPQVMQHPPPPQYYYAP